MPARMTKSPVKVVSTVCVTYTLPTLLAGSTGGPWTLQVQAVSSLTRDHLAVASCTHSLTGTQAHRRLLF